MKEYENDGNTYCHGIVNCKYLDDGECVFNAMGNGNPDDMPCLVRAETDIKAFREWREQKAKESKPERPTGEWKFKKFDEKTGIPNSYWCPFCGMVKAQVYDNFCGNCGADMRGEEP